MQELPFLHSARRLMLIDICMKFREDSFRGFQVTQRTRFVTDRQTDRWTDRHPGKNNMSPNPSGGDIIFISLYLKAFIQNLVQNGTAVSEKIWFEFLYVHNLGPRSRNDLDLQYSHTFMKSISCLYLPHRLQ